MNILTEMLDKTFFKKKVEKELSSTPDVDNIEQDLDGLAPTGFFDNGNEAGSFYGGEKTSRQKEVQLQNSLIKTYRRIEGTPEVSQAVSEIIDESVFSPGSKDILELDFKSEVPNDLKDKITKELNDISNKMNLNKNIYSMFKQFYVDGQLILHTPYLEKDINSGIQKYNILSPLGFGFNKSKDQWEYSTFEGTTTQFQTENDFNTKVFAKEEIIRIDSGIYSNNIIMSNLHPAIKPANMLSSLEDMLIPMRFMRSVSRRVFNVDVSNLNNKQAEEVMKKNQTKFKYKKFYDLESGTISNQQHVTALTEDYWFPNRGGEKGTTVDTIDETGNLGELSDVLYFKRKLYNALNVPSNRSNDVEPSEAEFDYTNTNIKQEELKFFNFVSRLRNQFLELFYGILKRSLISKGIVKEEEWDELQFNFKIKFVSENKFFEKMERETMSDNLNLFNDVEDLIGKYFSYEYIYKKVLKLSDEEIKEMAESLEKEKTSKLYSRFYKTDDDQDSW